MDVVVEAMKHWQGEDETILSLFDDVAFALLGKSSTQQHQYSQNPTTLRSKV